MYKELKRIKSFIDQHPLAKQRKLYCYLKVVNWQLSQLINPRATRVRFVESSFLLVEKGMTGATGNIYVGLLEFQEMSFLLHLLREGDYFGDIGANVGVYSVLASANAGADSLAIEPIPSTYQQLSANIQTNNINSKVKALQNGVGDHKGELFFSKNLGPVNHVLTSEEVKTDSERVEVKTLNEIFKDRCPNLIKIDVEGFEFPALKGGDKILSNDNLKAIIIELNASGHRYGYSDETIHELLEGYGFKRVLYFPFERLVRDDNDGLADNKIYIRDMDWTNERVKSAKVYRILGKTV